MGDSTSGVFYNLFVVFRIVKNADEGKDGVGPQPPFLYPERRIWRLPFDPKHFAIPWIELSGTCSLRSLPSALHPETPATRYASFGWRCDGCHEGERSHDPIERLGQILPKTLTYIPCIPCIIGDRVISMRCLMHRFLRTSGPNPW